MALVFMGPEFKVYVRDLKELLKATGNKNQKILSTIKYDSDDKRENIPLDHFLPGELKKLQDLLKKKLETAQKDKFYRDNNWTVNRIQAYFDLLEEAVDDKKVVKNVETLAIALKHFIDRNAPHRWLFEEGQDRISLPYFVNEIKYYKRQRRRDESFIPAHVDLKAYGYRNGSKISTSASWSEDTYQPMTVTQALVHEGLIIETATAVTEYLKSLEVYKQYQGACGEQVYATGDAYGASNDRWGYSRWGTTPMVRNGELTRVVLDPLTDELKENEGEDESHVFSTEFWDEVPDRNGLEIKKTKDVDPDEDEFTDNDNKPLDTVEVILPLHPYLYCFDLEKHNWIKINAGNLQPYQWDKKLIDKLILPKEQKELMGILMSTTGENVGDIIRGKMSGIIVLATGVPGVGKTLTAEVFSEHIEKPLYSVQCSQLGLDVSAIESELQKILQRASRWGAVLLIDEADVYVRERGEDIQQNAIVGVFLRLLEYYRGVLFMTSNRDVIDDAILSRATAWLKYELPDQALLTQIWHVLAAQYKVKLTNDNIRILVRDLPTISGRSVRNILKLATLLRGAKVTVADLINVSRYQALEKKE